MIKSRGSMLSTQNDAAKKTILYVDDDQMVLKVGSLMLRNLGYGVLTASEGQAAIEIFRKNDIDLVILDMRMPGMNGCEVLQKLKKIRPKAKILLASGYTGNYSEADLVRIGFDDIIEKPYRIEHISKKIENILSK